MTINPPGAVPWDCLIVKTPTYPLLAYIVTGPAGTDFTNSWTAAGVVVQVLQSEPATSASNVVMTSEFYVMGGTASTAVTTTVLSPAAFPSKWRATARSSTEYLVASDLNNQGTVTSGQYPARIKTLRPWLVVGASPNAYNYSLEAMQIPLNESDMTLVNPKVRVAPAKQGVYQPMYNAGPTFEWATARGLPALGEDLNFGGAGGTHILWVPPTGMANPASPSALPTLLAPLDTTTDLALNSWMLPVIGYPSIAGNPYSWGTTNELVGVSLYRGLSPNASITIKMVLAQEIVPMPTSPIRQFVKAAAENDPRAIQLYYDLVRDMPQSYPASSNFFGAILSAVGSILPAVLPLLPAVVGGISNLFGAGRAAYEQSRQPPPPPPLPAPPPLIERREYQPEMRASATSRPVPVARPRRAIVMPRRKVKIAKGASRARSSSVRSTRSRR
jgi:hypothetical protein